MKSKESVEYSYKCKGWFCSHFTKRNVHLAIPIRQKKAYSALHSEHRLPSPKSRPIGHRAQLATLTDHLNHNLSNYVVVCSHPLINIYMLVTNYRVCQLLELS